MTHELISEGYDLIDEVELKDGWREGFARVVGPKGEFRVQALRHINAPGLIVTSCSFGLFEVSHAHTGRRVVGHFERLGNAALCLADLSLCCDWSQSYETIKDQLEAHGAESCGLPMSEASVTSGGVKREMTKREMFESSRNWMLQDEFPWESGDEDPFDIASHRLSQKVPHRAERR
jgi:hypothetical protein